MRYAIILAIMFISSPALAKHHKHPFRESTSKHHHHAHYHGARHAHRGSGSAAGRPSAWCGWYMRQVMNVADSAYNLARNWTHWGHATSPHVGAVVVWSHHVGKIVSGSPGRWVVLSGNDGHRVKERQRSVAGAIAFRE